MKKGSEEYKAKLQAVCDLDWAIIQRGIAKENSDELEADRKNLLEELDKVK